MMPEIELPGCWTRDDLHRASALGGPRAPQARWPSEAVLLFLLNWALDNRRHTFERYLPEAWPMLCCMMKRWALPMASSPVTPAALCQARQRLPPAALELLHHRANEWLMEHLARICRWDGLQLWAVDGSWIDLPSERALEDEFGRPSGGRAETAKPLPQALLVSLEMLHAGWVFDYRLIGCDDAELDAGRDLSSALGPGDLLLADRLFFDSRWMSGLRRRGVELLFRATSVRWKSFCDDSRRRIEVMRECGHVVDCPVMLKVDTDHRGRPRGGLLPLRYVECPARRPGHETIRLITSLSEQRLPTEQSAVLYAERWGIETDYRFLKGQDHLPTVLSRKPETVRQEIRLRIMAHNWVRSVQGESCVRLRAQLPDSFPPCRHDTDRTGHGHRLQSLRTAGGIRRREHSGSTAPCRPITGQVDKALRCSTKEYPAGGPQTGAHHCRPCGGSACHAHRAA